MPRIPEETIERLKQEVSLERLATARGVKLTRHGADLIGLCPFHEDREPSLVPAAVAINEEDRAAALELLRDPDLTGRILRDFELCGVTGEETNKLTGYIAAVSRHLESPLAVILQSSSAAGKSSLMESILAFLPYRSA